MKEKVLIAEIMALVQIMTKVQIMVLVQKVPITVDQMLEKAFLAVDQILEKIILVVVTGILRIHVGGGGRGKGYTSSSELVSSS